MTRYMLGSIVAAMAFLALFATGPAHAASTPATSLPAAGTISETDVLTINQGSTTLKQTTVAAFRGYVVAYSNTFTGTDTFSTAPTFNTPLAVTSGGTGANSASGARSNFGLGSVATYNIGTSGAVVPLLSNSNTFTGDQTIASTDTSGSLGPYFHIYRNRASPAAGNSLGGVAWDGNDSAGNQTRYASIVAYSDVVTDGAETGHLAARTTAAGTSAERWDFGLGFYGALLTDPGSDNINAFDYQISGVSIFSRANTWAGNQSITGILTLSAGATPTISGCATTFLKGSNNLMRWKIATAGTACTITYANGGFPNGTPGCTVQDITSGTALPQSSFTSTGMVVGGSPSVNDYITAICAG